MQAYSNPKRKHDPHALPDVELWEVTEMAARSTGEVPGWYWWHCFPGCLPDSEPIGPFATEAEALADAQSIQDEREDI